MYKTAHEMLKHPHLPHFHIIDSFFLSHTTLDRRRGNPLLPRSVRKRRNPFDQRDRLLELLQRDAVSKLFRRRRIPKDRRHRLLRRGQLLVFQRQIARILQVQKLVHSARLHRGGHLQTSCRIGGDSHRNAAPDRPAPSLRFDRAERGLGGERSGTAIVRERARVRQGEAESGSEDR